MVEDDILDPLALERLFGTHQFDVVMHFCALSQVGESVRDPYSYYRNNVTGTLNLLKAMRRAGVAGSYFLQQRRSTAFPEIMVASTNGILRYLSIHTELAS
nr:GDP-mannose 4,6-dehydratase [Dyella flava]